MEVQAEEATAISEASAFCRRLSLAMGPTRIMLFTKTPSLDHQHAQLKLLPVPPREQQPPLPREQQTTSRKPRHQLVQQRVQKWYPFFLPSC